MWVSENRVLRRIFGSKRGEVTEEWRKLNNEELTMYYSGDEMENNEMGGHASRMGR